jgi:hypothetical protein
MLATPESVGLGAGTETRIAAVVGISKYRPAPAFPSRTLVRGDSLARSCSPSPHQKNAKPVVFGLASAI